MRKTILVTEKDTLLGNEIAQTFLNQGHRTVVSITPSQEWLPSIEQDNQLLVIPWNKRSAVSTKNFLLQAVQEMGSLDEAWLLFSPEHEKSLVHEIPASELEELLDQKIKGPLFLTRELLILQNTFPELKIHFVFFNAKKDHPPLATLQYQGLRAFVSAILMQAREKNLPIWAFETEEGQLEKLVSFVLNVPRELNQKKSTHGQWQRQKPKQSFFNQFLQKRTI